MSHLIPMLNAGITLTAWAGLDVAKDTFDAALYFPLESHQPPRPLEQLPGNSFARTAKGVASFLTWAENQLQQWARQASVAVPELRVVMEVTGRYSTELAAWLIEAQPDLRPFLANPQATSHFQKSLMLRNINDRIAARVLARWGFENKPSPPPPSAPEFLELRELSRQRDFIVESLVAARNRAEENTVSKKAAKIHKTLTRSLEKSLECIETEIKKCIQEHPRLKQSVKILDSIPGVGLWTAVVVLAELGDLTRFARSRQISSFSGLAPTQHRSGTSVNHRPHLSKQGSPRVRQALYMSAMAAIRGKNELHRFYQKLLENHKPKMVALGAVMRKQLVLMRSMLLHETYYNDNYQRAVELEKACA